MALNTAISALRGRTKTQKPVALGTAHEQVASPAPEGGGSRRIDLLYRMIGKVPLSWRGL